MLSDEQLKSEVTPLENASELLSQLQPKEYFFNHDLDTNIRLSLGANFGFLAQEVQTVLPDLVRSVKLPPQLDSTGFISGTESEYLGIQYGQLIPLLVAAFNEQAQLTDELPDLIAEQEEEINALKDLVAEQAEQLSAMQDALQQAVATFETAKRDMDSCCGGKARASPPGDAEGHIILEQNYPNPFTSETRIEFYLPRDARIVLEVSDGQGRKLHTLVEGQFAEGNHSTTWDAGRYAPGIYYCSLYADGELITKKMIKM